MTDIYEVVDLDPFNYNDPNSDRLAWLVVRRFDGALARKAEGRLGDMVDLAHSLNGEGAS